MAAMAGMAVYAKRRARLDGFISPGSAWWKDEGVTPPRHLPRWHGRHGTSGCVHTASGRTQFMHSRLNHDKS